MNGHQGWTTKASPLQNGELLTVTPDGNPAYPRLGFISCWRAARIVRCSAPPDDGQGRVRLRTLGPSAVNGLVFRDVRSAGQAASTAADDTILSTFGAQFVA